MTKTWLAALALALTGVAPLAAQHAARPGGISVWAVNHAPEAAPPANAPVPPPAILNAPVASAPAATLAAPVAQPQPAACCATTGCAGGQCGERCRFDWDRLVEWFCYKPLYGCHSKKGACGYNCAPPLYAFFLNDCTGGRKYELPPCATGERDRPSLFRTMFASRPSSCAPNCGSTCATPTCGSGCSLLGSRRLGCSLLGGGGSSGACCETTPCGQAPPR